MHLYSFPIREVSDDLILRRIQPRKEEAFYKLIKILTQKHCPFHGFLEINQFDLEIHPIVNSPKQQYFLIEMRGALGILKEICKERVCVRIISQQSPGSFTLTNLTQPCTVLSIFGRFTSSILAFIPNSYLFLIYSHFFTFIHYILFLDGIFRRDLDRI